jgi:hypothetical protein
MASPAASSLAELMRDPVESRSIAADIARSLRFIACRAIIEDVFVLITVMIKTPLEIIKFG